MKFRDAREEATAARSHYLLWDTEESSTSNITTYWKLNFFVCTSRMLLKAIMGICDNSPLTVKNIICGYTSNGWWIFCLVQRKFAQKKVSFIVWLIIIAWDAVYNIYGKHAIVGLGLLILIRREKEYGVLVYTEIYWKWQ